MPAASPEGKDRNFWVPCSMKSSPVTIRNKACSCGCHRESQVNSMKWVSEGYSLRRLIGGLSRPPEGSSVCPLLLPVRAIFGQQLARTVDHLDPVVERLRKPLD